MPESCRNTAAYALLSSSDLSGITPTAKTPFAVSEHLRLIGGMLSQCPQLTELAMRGCELRSLPPQVGGLTALKTLDLGDNLLKSTLDLHRAEIGRLAKLQIL